VWGSYNWFAVNKGADKDGPLAGVPYDGNDPANWDLYHEPHPIPPKAWAEQGNEPVRVVLADENWIQTNRIAGRRVCTPINSHWRWIASPELDPYPKQVVWRIGHQRWAIENHVFNELTQHYHLEHCPHHHPVGVMAWLLILVLGFNLFEVFVRLHSKLWQSGKVSLQELAIRLDRSLEHPDQLTPLWSG